MVAFSFKFENQTALQVAEARVPASPPEMNWSCILRFYTEALLICGWCSVPLLFLSVPCYAGEGLLGCRAGRPNATSS